MINTSTQTVLVTGATGEVGDRVPAVIVAVLAETLDGRNTSTAGAGAP